MSIHRLRALTLTILTEQFFVKMIRHGCPCEWFCLGISLNLPNRQKKIKTEQILCKRIVHRQTCRFLHQWSQKVRSQQKKSICQVKQQDIFVKWKQKLLGMDFPLGRIAVWFIPAIASTYECLKNRTFWPVTFILTHPQAKICSPSVDNVKISGCNKGSVLSIAKPGLRWLERKHWHRRHVLQRVWSIKSLSDFNRSASAVHRLSESKGDPDFPCPSFGLEHSAKASSTCSDICCCAIPWSPHTWAQAISLDTIAR